MSSPLSCPWFMTTVRPWNFTAHPPHPPVQLTNTNRYWRKKLSWTILVEQLRVPRYTAASKIGNSVISLLWQLRCHCNPDHNKLSSLSNTTVVAIFPNICLWRRNLCSNLGGIDPKKLYRTTEMIFCRAHVVNSDGFTYKWTTIDKSCHLFMF